jgi:hypothetical protein
MYSHHAVQAFAKFNHKEHPQVGKTTYRGGDRVGKLKLSSDGNVYAYDRRVFDSPREALDYQSSFSRDMNRLRCRLCEDHLNMGADIIVGDAWLKRNVEKKSIVGCRTARGESALVDLEREGAIVLEDASFADFLESQSSNLVYGDTARKMRKFLEDSKRIAPVFGYADADDAVRLTPSERIAINLELFRRYVARKHYVLYRTIFVIWKRLQQIIRIAGRVKDRILRS